MAEQIDVIVGTLIAAAEEGDLHTAFSTLLDFSMHMGENGRLAMYKNDEGDICLATESGVEMIIFSTGDIDVAGG